MTEKFLYFAYGSNMPQARLKARCPSAVLRGVGRLKDWQLRWNIKSSDGSAKCNIEKAAGETVFGVVYEIPCGEIAALREAEGFNEGRDKSKNTYQEEEIDVLLSCVAEEGKSIDEKPVKVKVYIGNPNKCEEGISPYDWYFSYILGGALEHNFPQDYSAALKKAEPRTDSDILRRGREYEIIRKFKAEIMREIETALGYSLSPSEG